MNFRTHGHGQGYLDVNGLIPEAVERVDYRKGRIAPTRATSASSARAQITTRDKMDPFALVEVGQYGYRRFVAGGSAKVGGGDAAVHRPGQVQRGPVGAARGLRGLLRACSSTRSRSATATFQASLNVYDASWAPTEQTPERAIGTPLCEDRFLQPRPDAGAGAPSARS